jgi:hypothetical protein
MISSTSAAWTFLAAGYDHVLLATAEHKIAVLVKASQITSMNPSIAKRL